MTEVLLEQLQVVTKRLIAGGLLDELTLEPEVLAEMTVEGLMVGLRAFVLAERVAELELEVECAPTFTMAFPANPWQHAKQRFAPDWFRRRFPVRTSLHKWTEHGTHTVLVEQFATFPASPLKTPPEHRGPVVVRYERARAREPIGRAGRGGEAQLMLKDRRRGVVYVAVGREFFDESRGWSEPVQLRFAKPTVDADPELEIRRVRFGPSSTAADSVFRLDLSLFGLLERASDGLIGEVFSTWLKSKGFVPLATDGSSGEGYWHKELGARGLTECVRWQLAREMNQAVALA